MPRAADAAAGEHIVTIDGQPYPVARAGDGLMWRVADQGSEVRTPWTEWAEMGEAERRTGRRYFFARRWDASVYGLLKLSPEHKSADPNARLSTDYGYFFEGEGAGTTLAEDTAAGNGTGTKGAGPDWFSFNQTVTADNDDRIMYVSVNYEATLWKCKEVKYAGQNLICLRGAMEDAHIATEVWYLLSPPTGTHLVEVKVPGYAAGAGASVWYNVDPDDPFRAMKNAKGQSLSPSVTVATVSGDHIFTALGCGQNRTITPGANETELWDVQQDSALTTGALKQAGSDGGAITPTLSGEGTPSWAMIAISMKPAARVLYRYCVDQGKITKFEYDPASGAARIAAGDKDVTDGEGGRCLFANSKWYAPMGTVVNAHRLDTIGTGSDTWASPDAGWKAMHLSTRQEGIVQGFARAHDTNKIAICNDTGNLTSWGGDFPVGDASTKITDLLELLDELIVSKEDNLWRFDQAAASEPVISWRSRSASDPDNGRGTAGHSGMVFYPSTEGLDRYLVGEARARPIGLDTLPFFRDVEEIDGPANGRHAFVVFAGPYLYVLFNHQQETYVCQARFREDHDPPGAELLWHSILVLPICKGAMIDSHKVLWLKGASVSEEDRNVFTVQLATGGSTDGCPARGQPGAEHYFYFDQVIDLPRIVKQLRLFVLEVEGFGTPLVEGTVTGAGSTWLDDSGESWVDDEHNYRFVIITSGAGAGQVRLISGTIDSTDRITISLPTWAPIPAVGDSYIITDKYVQPQVSRDGGSFEDLGNPIAEDGLHELNWTVGTNDQVRRPRMTLKAVTALTYSPAGEDPNVRFAELVQRAPSIYNVTIPLDDVNLQDQGPEDIRQTLLRLVNQGFVDIGEPDAVGDATWEGEVERVGFTSYVDEGGNVAGGIEVRIARYVVD